MTPILKPSIAVTTPPITALVNTRGKLYQTAETEAKLFRCSIGTGTCSYSESNRAFSFSLFDILGEPHFIKNNWSTYKNKFLNIYCSNIYGLLIMAK